MNARGMVQMRNALTNVWQCAEWVGLAPDKSTINSQERKKRHSKVFQKNNSEKNVLQRGFWKQRWFICHCGYVCSVVQQLLTSFTQYCGEDNASLRDLNLHLDLQRVPIRSPSVHMHISPNIAKDMEQNLMFTQPPSSGIVFSIYRVPGESASRIHIWGQLGNIRNTIVTWSCRGLKCIFNEIASPSSFLRKSWECSHLWTSRS